MARRRNKLGRALGDAIEETIQDRVEEALAPPEIPSEEAASEEGRVGAGTEEATLRKIVSAFPSTQGYYGKLYKILTSGKEEMKYYFSALEELDDPEVDVAEMAVQRKWGPGQFKLKIYKHGAPGVMKSLRFLIDVEDSTTSAPSLGVQGGEPETLSYKLKELSDIVSTARELFPKPETPQGQSPNELGKTLAETFKSGVEAMKAASPPAGSKSDLLQMLAILKELGVIGQPQRDRKSELQETLGILKELGLVRTEPQKDEFWSQLEKLKTLGLIKTAVPGDDETFASVEKLKTLIDLVTPLVSPGAEKANFAVEAVRVVGPHLPRIVENITSAVREVTEVSKMKLSNRLGAPMPRPAIRGPVAEAPETPIPPQENPEQIVQPHPVVTEILEAVTKNDVAYYPRLKELLSLFVGTHVNEALASGEVSPGTFMSLVSSYVPGLFNTPEAKTYLENFVEWLKHGGVKTPGGVVAKCPKCGAEFDFESKEYFESSPENKVCDCGEQLSLI